MAVDGTAARIAPLRGETWRTFAAQLQEPQRDEVHGRVAHADVDLHGAQRLEPEVDGELGIELSLRGRERALDLLQRRDLLTQMTDRAPGADMPNAAIVIAIAPAQRTRIAHPFPSHGALPRPQ